MTPRPARNRPRRGLALVLVMVHSVLILSAWAAANRQTVDLVKLKGWLADREAGEPARAVRSRRLALAYAVALLETGVPPESPYVCGVRLSIGEVGWTDHVLTFVEGESNRWAVSAAAGDIAGLDRPIRFGPPPSVQEPEPEP